MRIMVVGGVAAMHRKIAKCLAPHGHTVDLGVGVEASQRFKGIPIGVGCVLALYEMASHGQTLAARECAEEAGLLYAEVSRKWAVTYAKLLTLAQTDPRWAGFLSEQAGALPQYNDEEEEMAVEPVKLTQVVPQGGAALPPDVLEAARSLVEAMKTDGVQVNKIYFDRRHDGQYGLQFEVIQPSVGGTVL